MIHFPTKVLNERVGVFVDSFYEEMARLYRAQSWAWEPPRRTEGRWNHPDFAVRVARRFKDRAARTLELKAFHLPGVVSVGASGKVKVRYEHRFRIDIPRSYPSSLGAIAVRAMLPLCHPRIGPSGRGAACVYVNGEIDRVLASIIRHILLDPDYVQPPKLFRGQDRGMNLAAMNWFEGDPWGIHHRLLDLWAEAHGSARFITAHTPRHGVEIEA
jgi:hypothetical protein